MEAYFPVINSHASSTPTNAPNKTTKRDERKYKPYTLRDIKGKGASKASESEPSGAAVTAFLLSTLGNESNPITHSDSGQRATPVTSTSTGHQVAEGVSSGRRAYLKSRTKKINVQAKEGLEPDQPQVLMNVRCYINGYLDGTTDLEMKRIIASLGGEVLPTASNATHIITSMQLSGSKTDKLLKSRGRAPHVVRPTWITDSISAGKRLSEREYAVVKNTTTGNVYEMLQKKK